ncbi:MAG: alpha-amylase family glycosyl hydrolase [Chitinophagaceae bacterium]|nr:alpha-amylase family glycosyl hydrolase [Chitinophagaceae bacterium]
MKIPRLFNLCLLSGILIASCNNNGSSSKQTSNMNSANSKTVAWAATTNIYEVNTRQYTPEGTFNAFAKEIPRLKEMGVETLWFMPITPIAQKNKKGSLGSPYACSDYTSINPEFGTLEDFQKLVKEAHASGMKVIIDWVANHTGWDHVWTNSNPEYYLKDSATGDFQIASGMDDIIELDYSNPALRQAMVDAMKYWVETCDIDGFRCDLAAWVEVDFWQEARPKVDSVKKLFWLGEFDELDNPDYGKVFDASYTWSWMHKTREYYEHGLSLPALDSLLARYNEIGDGSMRAWFTSNHDENTWNGTEYEKYGNMAGALAVFSATWNGVPLLYSGQELPNHKRLEFFERDPIQWTGTYEKADFYKTLLQLKSNNPALRGADPAVSTYRLNTSSPDQVMAYLRKNGDSEVLVVINFSKENLSFTISDEKVARNWQDVFTNDGKNIHVDEQWSLAGWEYRVFSRK